MTEYATQRRNTFRLRDAKFVEHVGDLPKLFCSAHASIRSTRSPACDLNPSCVWDRPTQLLHATPWMCAAKLMVREVCTNSARHENHINIGACFCWRLRECDVRDDFVIACTGCGSRACRSRRGLGMPKLQCGCFPSWAVLCFCAAQNGPPAPLPPNKRRGAPVLDNGNDKAMWHDAA